MPFVNPCCYIVPFLICLVSVSVSIAFMALNKKDYSDSYDHHAYIISIVTVVIFVATYPTIKLLVIIGNCMSPVKVHEKEEDIEAEDCVSYSIYSSITYFVFSSVYAIYALVNHMITSSERSSGTRNASLAIAISVIINWSLVLLLILTEFYMYTRKHAALKIEHSTVIIGNDCNQHQSPSLKVIDAAPVGEFLPENAV